MVALGLTASLGSKPNPAHMSLVTRSSQPTLAATMRTKQQKEQLFKRTSLGSFVEGKSAISHGNTGQTQPPNQRRSHQNATGSCLWQFRGVPRDVTRIKRELRASLKAYELASRYDTDKASLEE